MKSFHTLRGFVTGTERDHIEPNTVYQALLRISSENGLDFEKIGSTLGLDPTKTVRRGNKVGPRSPASKQDVWTYRAPVPEEIDLDQHIDVLWQSLRPHVDFLLRLKSEAAVEVFLGYSSNIDHAGIRIRYQSLEMFSSLELDFGLNIVVLIDD